VSRDLRTWLAISIAGVWLASYVVSVIEGSFTGFQASTSVMLVAGMYLLANRERNGNGNANGKGTRRR
jgi:hypothetical protein